MTASPKSTSLGTTLQPLRATEPDEPPHRHLFAVIAWPPGGRLAFGLLRLLALCNLLELGGRLAKDLLAPLQFERAPLALLVRRIFFGTLLPWLLSLLLQKLFATRAEVAEGHLLLTSGELELSVPLLSIAEVHPLRLQPLGAGFSLELRSGRRLEREVTLPDPTPLLALLASGAGLSEPRVPLHAFADAAARARLWPLRHPLLQIGLTGSVLTFIRFRLHQLITYGGLLGELRLRGALPWLKTLSGVAFHSFGHLLVLWAFLRSAVELCALVTARAPGPWPRRARTALEWTAAVAFYGGITAALWLRLGD